MPPYLYTSTIRLQASIEPYDGTPLTPFITFRINQLYSHQANFLYILLHKGISNRRSSATIQMTYNLKYDSASKEPVFFLK